MLLDDIFDKLDASRVEQIIKLVSENGFGQIFITDTNRKYLDEILLAMNHDYASSVWNVARYNLWRNKDAEKKYTDIG